MKKIEIAGHIWECDAAMTTTEFEKIMEERDTPVLVYLTDTDEFALNEFTCLGGYDGTCNCASHDRKVWDFYSGDLAVEV